MWSGERVLRSLVDMQHFAHEIAQQLTGGELLLLTGELGAGKTTFVQGVAKSLGVADRVTSLTFTLVCSYPVPSHPTIKKLTHVDLYRLTPDQAAPEPAIREVLAEAKDHATVTLIEWADRLPPVAFSPVLRLAFATGSDSEARLVHVS